jgi:hypothetical protein
MILVCDAGTGGFIPVPVTKPASFLDEVPGTFTIERLPEISSSAWHFCLMNGRILEIWTGKSLTNLY